MAPHGRRGSEGSRNVREANRRRSDGGVVDNRKVPHANALEISRGVRPRLDHIQCPVTEKTLMDDVLTVQSGGNETYTDASLASTSMSSSTSNRDHSTVANDDDSESTDHYSDSDSGLNPADRHNTASNRSHRMSSSDKHRRSNSYLDGRKSIQPNRKDLEEDSQSLHNRRRLPKHYNTIPEAAAAHGSRSCTTHSKHRHDSPSKRNRSKTTAKIQKKDARNPNRPQSSQSSKLSTGIAQFQKMVAELESLSKLSSSSPEAMWKSRILLRSAKDADRDLQLALEREHSSAEGKKGVAVAAQKKLKRDYQRASEQLRSIVDEMERRQRAEISTLTASEAAASHREGAPNAQSRGAAVVEEEFFDRAMRERQDEVQKISEGMKKVQEIYTDLAGLVDDQQEQIDKLQDLNEEVKADTRAGLEEIQHGIWKLCAAEGPETPKEGGDGATHRGKRKETIPDPRKMLGCMMDCPGLPTEPRSGRGILSLHDVQQSSVHARMNYYSDETPVTSNDWRWNLPNLEEVQESAQSAYERGHAMVGGLVEHARREGLPLQLGEEFTNRLSCTPQAGNYASFGDDDCDDGDDGDDDDYGVVDGTVRRFDDNEPSMELSDENYHREEEFEVRHHRDGHRQRSHSRSHRSRSRSGKRERHGRNDRGRGQRRSTSSH